jgi:hypothetical protein
MIDLKKLKDSKAILIAEKMATLKHADVVVLDNPIESIEKITNKTESGESKEDPTKLKVKVVINTTNIMDSHSDVHIKGLWKKTLKENKNLFLLQEHEMKFDKIISDKINAFTEDYTYKGSVLEALVFETEIDKDRNPFMFEQYKKGFVKNHSVGMRYVKIDLAINSEEKYYANEKKVWDKYIDEVVNRNDAEKQGYFWAVTEAKAVEGSAVVIGSNQITPTLEVEEKNIEPLQDTQKTEAVNTDTSKEKVRKIYNFN